MVSVQRSLTFVSPRFLFPTDSGGKIRTTQILRGLKGGAFRVTLVMPSSEEWRRRYADEIRSVSDELLSWDQREDPKLLKILKKIALLAGRVPIPVASDFDQAGATVVRESLGRQPDAVVFDFPHSVVLAPEHIGCPSVLFTHNVEAEIFERHCRVAATPIHRLIWRDQYRKMRRYERAVLSRFDSVVAVSERDRRFFRDNYGIKGCQTIPTGVDTEFFAYEEPRHGPQVVFCGSMDWMANVDGVSFFFDEVWPLIRKEVPAARMKVVGRSPPDSLVRRVRDASNGWEFTGFVDDVRCHIPGAAAFVIPLRVGGGTRIKAFEAMAMGTPVVSTSIGIEGLPVDDGVHYLRADEPAELADRVVSLLTDNDLRSRISSAARKLVEEHFDFRHAAHVFERICLDAVRGREASAIE